MAGRRCPEKGCPVILTGGERRCGQHARAYERRRGTAKQRGYDATHEQLRRQWQRRLDAGEVVLCSDGCGRRIDPTAWQLGHDHVNGGYLGPQTVPCNASDGGRRGNAAQR